MALEKSFTLPSGISGNYVRLVAHRWDRATRESSALFALYVDAATAQSGKAPLTPWIAKLWLRGDKFDQYLSNAELTTPGILAQLYVAVKAEPISCDFGENALADAVDV
jgi:hypothetical protein